MKQTEKLNVLAREIFQYSFKKGKTFYFRTWAKSPPRLAVFQGEIIHISREGWEHIVEDVSRHWVEIIVRICLFERAKDLLEGVQHYQEHQKRGACEFWGFRAEVGGVNIKVVVRSINKGAKHLYSVMPKGTVANVIIRKQKHKK